MCAPGEVEAKKVNNPATIAERIRRIVKEIAGRGRVCRIKGRGNSPREKKRQGSSSATTAIPKEYAELANLLEKTVLAIDFEDWAKMTAKQQLTAAQKAGLSEEDQRALLNAAPHYVETIAEIQGLFADRYALGLTLAGARDAAKELFDIANEREAAITRTGKFENDAVFAPRVLRWLDEQEKKILENLTKKQMKTIGIHRIMEEIRTWRKERPDGQRMLTSTRQWQVNRLKR